MAVNLTINGEKRRFEQALTLEALLLDLGIRKGKVAIERNLAIVPRSLYAETRIEDGDQLEIVHFIGGG